MIKRIVVATAFAGVAMVATSTSAFALTSHTVGTFSDLETAKAVGTSILKTTDWKFCDYVWDSAGRTTLIVSKP